jgi:hypothetical protein
MFDLIFNASVWLLYQLAGGLGTTYKAINVWIFVIVWPLLTAAMVVMIARQRALIRHLRGFARDEGAS